MKVLVTGVKGQLGYDVVKELEKREIEAVGVDIVRWILPTRREFPIFWKKLCRMR